MGRHEGNPRSFLIGLLALTVVTFLAIGFANPDFLSFASLSSMGFQCPEFGLMALAVLPTMISGGIDLSVVSVANLASIIAALMLKDGHGWAAMPVAVFAGTLCGLLNGVLVGYARLPAILATLGTMQLVGGLGIVVTRGPAITGLPDWYPGLVNASLGGLVPFPLLVFAAVAILLGLVLRFSSFGLQTRLYGANPVAARFAGIPERRLLLSIYAASGLISALAGLVVLGRANSAYADYGSSYMLLVVLINILAGVSPSGGFGTVTGVILAVLLLQLISSGLNFLSFSAFMRDLFFGGLLVVVMSARVFFGQARLFRWLARLPARP
jgi:simple sugar transport system permease protein